MKREQPVYVDSSIVVATLTRDDPRRQDAQRWLLRQTRIITSAITEVEVGRVLARRGASQALREAAAQILAACDVVEITPSIREAAVDMLPASLRGLDAVHVATARVAEVVEFATYDVRQQVAAEEASIKIAAVR